MCINEVLCFLALTFSRGGNLEILWHTLVIVSSSNGLSDSVDCMFPILLLCAVI